MIKQEDIISIYDKLLNFSKRFYFESKDNSLDLVQDTLVRIWENQDKFKEGTNLYNWSCIVMKNLFINEYTKQNRNPVFCEEIFNLYHLSETEADSHINTKELYSFVQTLSASKKEVLFDYMRGLKYKEIAKKRNIPIDTVKTRLFNSRKEIKKYLKE